MVVLDLLCVSLIPPRKLNQHHCSARLSNGSDLRDRRMSLTRVANAVIRVEKNDAGFPQGSYHVAGPRFPASCRGDRNMMKQGFWWPNRQFFQTSNRWDLL
jgi:hypothetical protein